MKDLLDKLSSYNLFNYFLPGVVFVFVAKEFIGYNLILENTLIGAFLYYFIGMIVSRFGSLIIEPIFKKTSFIKFSDYSAFVAASKKDVKVDLLSEVNNTYRTIISMFTISLLLKLYSVIEEYFVISNKYSVMILIILVTIMFAFSYRKQSEYINKRVEANKPVLANPVIKNDLK